MTTLAGSTEGGSDGTGTNAQFISPFGITVAPNGNMLVLEKRGVRVRMVTPAGLVTSLAGSTASISGYVDGQGTNVKFSNSGYSGIALMGNGNAIVGDYGNCRLRVVTPTGAVTTLAGGVCGVSADLIPSGLAVASNGNIIVADTVRSLIRLVTPTGSISTLAGATLNGFADGLGTNAKFLGPRGVAIFINGNVAVADYDNCRIRIVTPAGAVSTLAGSGRGSADGVGTNARFLNPTAVAVSSTSNIVFVLDDTAVRAISPSGFVTTLTLGVSLSINGNGNVAGFGSPHGIGVTAAGSLVICDETASQNMHLIRLLTPTACPIGFYCPGLGNGISPTFLPCPAGSFCPNTSMSAPTPCAPGSYSSITQRTSCLLCAPGSYTSTSGLLFCDQYCPVGTFRALPGGASLSDCKPCAAGSYALAEGSTSCTACPAGAASAAVGASAASTCTPCAPGSASSLPGAAICAPCALGSFAPSTGALTCSAAPAGSFVPLPGATAASPCAPGSASSLPGAALCAPCAAGTFAPLPGALACAPAPPGTFVPAANATAALACPPGTANTASGATSADDCVACAPGSYAPAPGARRCSLCSAGTGSNAVGATSNATCAACPAGTFNPAPGQSLGACQACPAGSASAAVGATSAAACAPCSPSQYAPAGSSTCASCPPNSSPDATQSTCLAGVFSCPAGSQVAAPGGAACVPLLCAAPLAPPDGAPFTACEGCAANSSGAYPSCLACAAAAFCPGATANALRALSAPDAALAAACPPLAGPLALAPSLLAPRAAPYGVAWLTGVLSVDNAIITGLSFALVACAGLAAASVLARIPSDAARGAAARLAAALARADVFTPADRVVDGRLQTTQRAVGGAFTVLGGIAFSTLALTLILQRAADNVATSATVLLLTPVRARRRSNSPSLPTAGAGDRACRCA